MRVSRTTTTTEVRTCWIATPSIRSFAEILLTHATEDPETTREFLSIIHEESIRLTRLVNNLLDLSRMQAGRMVWT